MHCIIVFCVAGCGQLIGCFYCTSRLEDCPLCRVSLPDAEIRKPLKVSGLAAFFGIPDISMTSALREASIDVNNVADGEINVERSLLYETKTEGFSQQKT